MRYVIAPKSAVSSRGIIPASTAVIEGNTVLNENELKFRYPDKPFDVIVGMLDGTSVSRVAALDFLNGRKTITQIKQTGNE